jgi:hypothetical protein
MGKKGTTCKKCNRFVWEEDVGKERVCCFCKPKESGDADLNVVYGTPKRAAKPTSWPKPKRVK